MAEGRAAAEMAAEATAAEATAEVEMVAVPMGQAVVDQLEAAKQEEAVPENTRQVLPV